VNTATIIRNDQDAELFRQNLQAEMGLTDEEWWLKTDPNDPPFKPGDKVWVDHISGGRTDRETVQMLREVQTVEKVTPMPCSDGPLWSVDLVGTTLCFSQHDLRKAE
jgi:hypothetical protein